MTERTLCKKIVHAAGDKEDSFEKQKYTQDACILEHLTLP